MAPLPFVAVKCLNTSGSGSLEGAEKGEWACERQCEVWRNCMEAKHCGCSPSSRLGQSTVSAIIWKWLSPFVPADKPSTLTLFGSNWFFLPEKQELGVTGPSCCISGYSCVQGRTFCLRNYILFRNIGCCSFLVVKKCCCYKGQVKAIYQTIETVTVLHNRLVF